MSVSVKIFDIKSAVFLFCTILGVAAALPVSSALAGFEWTPPPPAATAPVPAPVSAAPGPSGTPMPDGPLTPEPDSAGTAPLPVPVGKVETGALPAPSATPDLPVPGEATGMKTITKGTSPEGKYPAPVSPPDKTVKEEPKEEIIWSTPIPAKAEFSPLQGFGKDISLALALRQIVPAEYAFGFESGELAGIRISWQGGKPWPAVLSDSLSAVGLQASISGKAVLVSRKKQEFVAEAVPAFASTTEDSASVAPLSLSGSGESKTSEPTAPPLPVLKNAAPKAVWTARPGATLRDVLTEWSVRAHVDLDWVTPYDYPIANAFTYKGTFSEAVNSLLSGYSRETPRPRGRLYPNLPAGPSVLMIN